MTQEFHAEIKQVKATKTASSDIEIRVLLATDDITVLDLGKLPAKTLVKVTIEAVPEKGRAQSFNYV